MTQRTNKIQATESNKALSQLTEKELKQLRFNLSSDKNNRKFNLNKNNF